MRVRSLPAIFNRGMAILKRVAGRSAVPSVCDLTNYTFLIYTPGEVMRARRSRKGMVGCLELTKRHTGTRYGR